MHKLQKCSRNAATRLRGYKDETGQADTTARRQQPLVITHLEHNHTEMRKHKPNNKPPSNTRAQHTIPTITVPTCTSTHVGWRTTPRTLTHTHQHDATPALAGSIPAPLQEPIPACAAGHMHPGHDPASRLQGALSGCGRASAPHLI